MNPISEEEIDSHVDNGLQRRSLKTRVTRGTSHPVMLTISVYWNNTTHSVWG